MARDGEGSISNQKETGDLGSQQKDLFKILNVLSISYDNVPYREMGQRNGMKGIFCKNLFLKDRQGKFYLLICTEDKMVDLKALRKTLGASRNFSFGTEEDLGALLGVTPGAVNPFALMYAPKRSLRFVMDEDLATCSDLLNFHPMTALETTLISYVDLQTFVLYVGHEVEVVHIQCCN